MIAFFVEGVPIAKARPRVMPSGHTYTPAKTKAWEGLVRLRAQSAPMRIKYAGAVEVLMTFMMPMPKGIHKSIREAVTLGQDTAFHIVRPDGDNLAKAVLDACNGVLWSDDAQVAILTVTKQYAITPGVAVRVKGL